jgi:phage-related protein
MVPPTRKPLYFIASSWKDLKGLPGVVQDTIGTLLLDVQYEETPFGAKPLKGCGLRPSRVPEEVEVPKRDLDLVQSRYDLARQHYERYYESVEEEENRHA